MNDDVSWKVLCLRIVAATYSALPLAIPLDASIPLGRALQRNDDGIATGSGAIKWLYDNGMIHGKVVEERPEKFCLAGAQPSAALIRLLEQTESNMVVQPFGAAIVRAAKEGGRDEIITADLLMLRMTGA